MRSAIDTGNEAANKVGNRASAAPLYGFVQTRFARLHYASERRRASIRRQKCYLGNESKV